VTTGGHVPPSTSLVLGGFPDLLNVTAVVSAIHATTSRFAYHRKRGDVRDLVSNDCGWAIGNDIEASGSFNL
jgi:hypothetical protein